ncbi:hypothetical protein ACWELJ_06100 [Nocardia sp. NPDC004582]
MSTPAPAGWNAQQPGPATSLAYGPQQNVQTSPFDVPGFLQQPQRRSSKWWAWGLGGAVLASVVWAGGIFAFSGSGGTDLRGYHYVENLCGATDIAALRGVGYEISSRGTQYRGTTSAVIDTMNCQFSLDNTKNTAAGALFSATATLHKKNDFAAEFSAANTGPVMTSDGYKVEITRLSGLGDEAYGRVETGPNIPDGRVIAVSVRDAGLIFEISAAQPMVSSTAASDPNHFSVDATVEILRSVAKATMVNLRS